MTGIGIVSAIGHHREEFSRNLFAGKTGIRKIQSFDATPFRTQTGAEVSGIDLASYVTHAEFIQFDRLCLLMIAAADEATADAALHLEQDGKDLGVILGTGLGPSSAIEDSVRRVRSGARLRPTTILRMMLSSPAAALCARYQARRESHVHVTACASSAHAIGQAADYIRSGGMDLCLAGGCDAFPSFTLFAAWDAMGIMSPDNEQPSQAVRPFSAGRTGFVIGEGAAALVLESEKRANSRGARIYAELAGCGSCSDTPSLTKPSVEGMVTAMSRGLRNAGLTPDEIGHVNAHGTATQINDNLETRALHQVFGDHARDLQISATKASHGHTMGAAGAVEAVATILALQHGLAPPTLNLREADPQCDLNYTAGDAREMNCSAAISNSFAFGGHYVSLLFNRAPAARLA